ncbi:DEAD/DEAH box helicase [Thiosulfativibrio zosterae]|uniref:Helicase SNF2 n=1 Tax=Thiosulfativibrio zosterae TaxID=2675053 RepID=A0A6F8PJM9_9GAMM|nr:DEAD/DEAH box helicase [Thiosulfativibrio zosterae]BBP42278.1 hypothetical protein THMIRHAT_00240 [Thiosulfativibrio zosterae]
MPFEFTTTEIEALFEEKTFERAVDIYRQGKVRSVTLEPTTSSTLLKLKGITQGSYNERYMQHISLTRSPRGLILNSSCTCPMGYDCKHAAAVLLKAHNQLQQPQGLAKSVPAISQSPANVEARQFEQWLQTFAKQQLENLPEKPQEHEFRYRLFSKAENPHNLPLDSTSNDLDIWSQHLTATGRLSNPKKVTNAKFLDGSKYGYSEYSDASEAIGQLLSLCTFGPFNKSQIVFKEACGFFALKTLVETGQCFFKNNEPPLQWRDEPIEKPLVFNEQAQRFELPFGNHEFWVFCEPPVLINTQTNQVQPIKSSLSGASLYQLLQMPKANTALLSRLLPLLEEEQARLTQQKRQKVAPLPKIKGLEDKEIAPDLHPILRLIQHPNHVVSFELDCYYPPYTCHFFPRTTSLTQRIDGQKIILKRQVEAEDKAILRLMDFLLPLNPEQDQIDPYGEPMISPLFWDLPGESLATQMGLEAFLALQDELPNLADEGWILEGFAEQTLEVLNIEDISVESQNQSEWFELGFDMVVNGQSIPLEPIIHRLIGQYQSSEEMPDRLQVLNENQQVFEFSKTQIAPIFDTLIQLYKIHDANGDKLRLSRFDAHLIAGLSDAPIRWLGSKDSLKLAEKLKTFQGIQTVQPPQGLQAQLREYQQFGLNWLGFMHEFGFNGILADDMGLGKTLQTLSFLLHLKETQQLDKPALLVVPTSLIGNWKAEAARFVPDLKLLTLHGQDRFSDFEHIPNADLVLTTYPLIPRDAERFAEMPFSLIILDEAQKIKNPTTKLYQSLQCLKAQHRLALTGTPVENHLGELWALFNFLMPGFLGNLKHFKATYQKPIELEGNRAVQTQLNQKVAPFLLRRTKHQVVNELPDKTEIIRKVEFEKDQAQLYETIRLTMTEKVREAVAQNGLAKSQITLLDALLKLRQVCCDPGLVKLDAASKVKHSAKLELLMDLVTELLEGDHRILIFSQFTSMLRIIEDALTHAKIAVTVLTGQTKKRDEAIERFRSGEVDVFLISLKAGGVGLNLTEADSVIHYDPWWNPAAENQATDRAYRIGQDKEVFVYKLVVANSIEEKILNLQAKKQALQDQLYQKSQDKNNAEPDHKLTLSGEDLMALLQS